MLAGSIALALCVLLAFAPHSDRPPLASAASQPQKRTCGPALKAPLPLRRGSTGRRVCDLQWLLAGHKPSRYAPIRTFRRAPNGQFGARTAKAVLAMKYRLGFPRRALQPIAGRDLFDILEGKRARPIGYIYRAAARLAKHGVFVAKRTACANRLIRTALHEVGVREIPDGSNDGPRVHQYQAVTGAFRAPWCASFDQWVAKTAGYGTFADDSAYVPYIHDYAYRHAWLRAIPIPGALVMFGSDFHHIGIVVRIDAAGVQTVEGNYANSVAYVYHRYGEEPMAYAWLPGCFR
jgi:hypothetical protein